MATLHLHAAHRHPEEASAGQLAEYRADPRLGPAGQALAEDLHRAFRRSGRDQCAAAPDPTWARVDLFTFVRLCTDFVADIRPVQVYGTTADEAMAAMRSILDPDAPWWQAPTAGYRLGCAAAERLAFDHPHHPAWFASLLERTRAQFPCGADLATLRMCLVQRSIPTERPALPNSRYTRH